MTQLMTIEFQGLDEFRRRLGNPATLEAELKKAEREGLDAIKAEAKGNAASFSNVLPASIRSEVRAGGLEGVVGSVAKTALSIEQGRRPGNAPSYELTERWLTHKGVGAAQRIASRRYIKPRKGSAAAATLRGEAIQVINLIRQHGTKPLPFIIPAAQQSSDKVGRIFDSAVTRALKKLVK